MIAALRDALRMEVRRITSVRSTVVLAAVTSFAGAVVALMIALLAPDGTTLARGRTVAALTAGGDSMPMSVVGGLMAVLGVLAVGQDYRYRLLPAVFAAAPRRGAVVAARLIVLGVVATGVAVSVSVLGAAICGLLGRPPTHDVATLRVVAAHVVLSVLWAWLGAGLTWLSRSSAASVSVLLLGPLLVEPLISLLGAVDDSPGLHSVLRWLPFAAARQALGPLHGTAETLGALAAGAEFTAVTLVVVAGGWLVVRRRDA